MQTQLMNDVAAPTQSWLDHYPNGEPEPERTWIDTVPFTIGRNDDVALTVPSGRVSREHAQITFEGGCYFVQDLGSTNGTYLNGASITKVELQDGDVITIADVEFNFFLEGEETGSEAIVTQVISDDAVPSKNQHVQNSQATDAIQALRRLHEQTLHCCVGCDFLPIVQLKGQVTFGYRAQMVAPQHEWLQTPSRLQSIECRSNERINDLFRLFAVESSAELLSDAYLFLSLASTEVGMRWLPETINRIQLNSPHFQRIVVEISDSVVCDIPYFRNFLSQLREQDIRVSYADFVGGYAQIEEMRNVLPDFLAVSPTLIRGIDRSSGGQRQLQDIVAACQRRNIQAIASGVYSEQIAEIVAELGCLYAEGDLYT